MIGWKKENIWMLLFHTFFYINMKLIIRFFQTIFHPCYNSYISLTLSRRRPLSHRNWFLYDNGLHLERVKYKVYRFIESQSNTTIDSLSSHLYTNVMICKLKKLIIEVSSDLKIYFIYSVYSYRMKKILHLNSHCLFLLKKSKTLYSGHFI